MNEAAITGVLITTVSAIVLTIGFATGEIPFNYSGLDTKRATAPAIFWAFFASWLLFAIFGVGIAIRHWGG